MQRKMDIPLYVISFVITGVIFAIGFMLGTVYDGVIGDAIANKIASVSDSTLSIQMLLLMNDDKDFCEFYDSELKKIDSQTEELGYQLSYLEENKKYSDPVLKDKYFVLEYTSLLMSRKMNTLCNEKYNLIMYFYSNKECGDDCILQGRELLKVKESLGENVRIYSFDCTINSTIANSLCDKYKIAKYPTIIYNNKKVSGYVPASAIANDLK